MSKVEVRGQRNRGREGGAFRRFTTRSLFLLGGCIPLPFGLDAQSSRLVESDRLLTEGRFEEARQVLEGWYEAEGGEASRGDREYAIWLHALLTTDPQAAELDYRRLVIEYPGGSYSDGALLRLAQGARAWGDLEAARRYLEILVRDYPQSPMRVEARTFLARLDQPPALTGIVTLPASSTPTPAPTVSAPASSAAPAVPPPSTVTTNSGLASPQAAGEAPEDFPLGAFTLQLGAFSTEERARELATGAGAAGVQIRIVKVEGSDFIRVRHGIFATREEAEAQARVLRELGFESVISSDREREEE